jgi:hypothetical protein
MNLFDDDDYMVTSPKENFFNIIHTANKDLVNLEIEKVIERLAIAEHMLEERGLEEELDQTVKNLPYSDPGMYENLTNSLFISTVGAIVSNQE